MKDRDDIVRLVCVPHCRFYREGEKEEMSCEGYNFIKDRMDRESGALAESEKLAGAGRPPERFDRDARIEAAVCGRCEFRAADCDFMGGEDLPGSAPCGGYVLLARLLEAGVDEVEDWLDVPL